MKRFDDLHGVIFDAAKRVIDPFTSTEQQEIRVLARSYVDQLRKLGAAIDRNDPRAVHSRTHWMLTSPGNKVVAMILAYPACGKCRPKVCLGRIKARARQFDMYQPTGEMVVIEPKAKADGKSFRPIAKFGIGTRAAQRLALDTMRAIWGESSFEFARRGRGRDAMIEHIADIMNSGRNEWIGEADLRDFFPSFDQREVLKTVPLPRSVTRHHVLMSSKAEIIMTGKRFQVSETAARAGLTQGSLTAPYVASKMLEPLLDISIGENGCSYIDNITVCGRTEDEVKTRLGTLASTVSEHPAGRHHLKFQRTSPVGNRTMDITGYRFRRDAAHWGSEVRALPSSRAITSQERQLLFQLVLVGDNHHETTIATWARRWPLKFPQWKGRKFASDIAEIKAIADVWPLARMIRRAMSKSQKKFGSFAELRDIIDRLASLHHDEPDWSAIEAGGTTPRGFVVTPAMVKGMIEG